MTRLRWYLGWPLALWRRRFPEHWTQTEIYAIHARAHARYLRMQQYIDYPDAEIEDDSPCASGCRPDNVCGGPRCT